MYGLFIAGWILSPAGAAVDFTEYQRGAPYKLKADCMVEELRLEKKYPDLSISCDKLPPQKGKTHASKPK